MPWICTVTPLGQGPKGPLAGDGDAGLVEQRAACAGPSLGEPLGRSGAPGEAGIDELVGQAGHRPLGAIVEHFVPEALKICDAVVDSRGSLAVEEVRGMHVVPASAQLRSERAHAVGKSLHVVEQHNLGHLSTLLSSDHSHRMIHTLDCDRGLRGRAVRVTVRTMSDAR
jgi:hypothetical protein